MTEVTEDYELPAGRPTFITVLCILTFIGSGLGLINQGMKYFTASTQAAAISVTKDKVNSDLERKDNNTRGSRFAEKIVTSLNISAADIRHGALAGMVAAVLCLAGAFIMWNLKKAGFYLYLAGILVNIISPLTIFGGGNFIAIIASVGTGFIGVLFVILYGINLKCMK